MDAANRLDIAIAAQELLNNLLEDDILDDGYVCPNPSDATNKQILIYIPSRYSPYPFMWGKDLLPRMDCLLESTSGLSFTEAFRIIQISFHWKHPGSK